MMTVRELIEMLQALSDDAQSAIVVIDPNSSHAIKVVDVEVEITPEGKAAYLIIQ